MIHLGQQPKIEHGIGEKDQKRGVLEDNEKPRGGVTNKKS